MAAAGLGALARKITPSCADEERSVMTVRGPVEAGELGRMLPHEHVLVDFAPVEELEPGRYDSGEAFDVILPHLERLKALGCQTVAECTPAYLGRDVRLLLRLSEASGLHILTNTGYYGARDDQHLPEHAFTESADGLAARWVREWEEGIDGTDVQPGFMKIGVDAGPLSDVDRKLVRAAARAHLATGLTMAVHTGPATGAFDELDVLAEEGVHPSAWIWVHAQNEDDLSRHVEAAQQGGWVEFDGVHPDRIERHVELVINMKRHGLLGHTLISHDAGWYRVGEPGDGDFRAYNTLFDDLLPALQAAGLTDEDVRQLVVRNPAEAFAVRVRES